MWEVVHIGGAPKLAEKGGYWFRMHDLRSGDLIYELEVPEEAECRLHPHMGAVSIYDMYVAP